MTNKFTETEIEMIVRRLGWEGSDKINGVKRTIALALQYARTFPCPETQDYKIEGYAEDIARDVGHV